MILVDCRLGLVVVLLDLEINTEVDTGPLIVIVGPLESSTKTETDRLLGEEWSIGVICINAETCPAGIVRDPGRFW